MAQVAQTSLLEREHELAVLARLLEDAAAGQGAVALVEGEPGIGKTSLLGAARELADEPGFRVLAASGNELEVEFPFGVVRQLFEGIVARSPKPLLSGAAAHAAPVLGTEAGDPGGSLFAALHGLYWLATGLCSDRPLLLVVDDAHWADEPSLRWLAYLARRVQGLQLLLLIASRSGKVLEEQAPLAAIAAAASTHNVRPAPLGPDALAEAVADRLGGAGDNAFVSAVQGATGGNPFLVVELLRELRDRGIEPQGPDAAEAVNAMGPETISRVVVRRLEGLSEDAVDLASALAVLGHDDERRYAGELAGLGDAEAAVAADLLVDAAILVPGRALAFAHPLVWRAVYESLTPGVRAVAHEHAARIMYERGAPPEAVASHLLEAPAHASDWAVDRLSEAAEVAASRGSPGVAVAFLRRTLREPPPRDRLAALTADLAGFEALTGDPDAIARFQEARRLETDPNRRADLGLALGRTLLFAGQPDEAVDVLLDTAAEDLNGDRERRLVLASELMGIEHVRPGARRRFPPDLSFEPEGLTGATRGERALLSALAVSRLMASAPPAPGVELARRTLSHAGVLAEEGAASNTWLSAMSVLLMSDELDLVDEWLEQAGRHSRRQGDVAGHVATLTFRSHAAYRRGALPETLEDARDAMTEAVAHGLDILANLALTYLIDGLLETGDLDEAHEVASLHGLYGELPDQFHFNSALARRGRLRAARGDLEDGLADLLEAGRRFEAAGVVNPAISRWRSDAALVLAGLGRDADATGLVNDELRLARNVGQQSSIAAALRVAARVSPADAETLLEQAAAAVCRCPDRLLEAHVLTDTGAWLRRAGRRTEAREPLRRALDIATERGADALAERARDELAAAGARPRTAALSGVASLTPSELRCARMAARGMTNRAIAQELFVTVRAVEMHLTSAYRKLGVRSRRELAPVPDLGARSQ